MHWAALNLLRDRVMTPGPAARRRGATACSFCNGWSAIFFRFPQYLSTHCNCVIFLSVTAARNSAKTAAEQRQNSGDISEKFATLSAIHSQLSTALRHHV